jgi:hypothetical protein
VVAFLQANWQTVVAFLQALLTPTIAVLTVVIAVAQYRLAKAQFRHELYERRSAVFKATMKFIAQVTSGGNAKLDELQTFLRDTTEVAFLFETRQEIQPFLDALYEQGLLVRSYNSLLECEGLTEPPREELPKKINTLVLGLTSNLTNAAASLRRICRWSRTVFH